MWKVYPALRSLWFALIIGLFLVILALVLTQPWMMRSQINQAKADSLQRMGAYETSLLATIDRHLYLPKVLAFDPRIVKALAEVDRAHLVTDESLTISRLLKRINRQAGSDQIFLMGPGGMTFYSSNYDSAATFVGENYSFRPYFREAMVGKNGLYFAVGATTGVPGLFLSAPVYADNGHTLGVIVVKIDLGKLEASWQASGDAVWVTDQMGIVFLASNPRWRYFSMRPLPEQYQSELALTRQYGKRLVKPLTRVTRWQSDKWSTFDLDTDGAQLVFNSPIENFPWQMHLRVPLEQVRAQVQGKQSLIILLYAAIAVGVLFYRERHRRTQAQQALSRLTTERESHQRAIIQNTDVGLLNLDARFKPLFLNEQARALFRLEDEGGFGDPAELISPWDPEKAGNGSCRAVGVRSDGGRFPVLYTLNPIRVGDQSEFILTIQDITELTAAQRALQDANKALEHRVEERTRDLEAAQAALAQNQKLAALGRMSAAIAHEINQPITALSNFVASSQVLLARNRPESVRDNLQKIKTLVERLSKLSRQLRIFAGKRNSGSAVVSLQAPVNYALELLAPRLETELIECSCQLGQDYLVHANAMVLEQIVVNLMTNAIDALAGKDDAHIAVRMAEVRQAPGKVSLSIEDNGYGMTEDQLNRVFEPFFTTKPMGKGLGLGLAISYSLACDIGADLTVTSQLGEGTCFSLTITREPD